LPVSVLSDRYGKGQPKGEKPDDPSSTSSLTLLVFSPHFSEWGGLKVNKQSEKIEKSLEVSGFCKEVKRG
jgi:hypothetical protein